MKLIATCFLSTLWIWGFAQNKYTEDKIILKDSLYLLKSNLLPATGIVYCVRDAGAHVYKIEYGLENGVLEGEYKYKYENGQLSQIEFYRNGKRVGPRRRWWMNGNPQSEWNSNSRKYWYKNGQLREQVEFDDNGMNSRKCWSESGELITCQ